MDNFYEDSWMKRQFEPCNGSESTRSFQEISEFELSMLGQALTNLTKKPERGILKKRKSNQYGDRLLETNSITLDEIVHVIVYDKDVISESVETQVIWSGFLLVGHVFKNFLDSFVGSFSLKRMSRKRSAFKFWKRIMVKGTPKLLCRDNIDGLVNHRSCVNPYVPGVVPLPKDFDLPRKELKNKKNVYSRIKRKELLSIEKRHKVKKRTDLKGAHTLKASFKKRFNNKRVEANLIANMFVTAVENMESAKQSYFKTFKEPIFQQYLIGFAILKSRVDTYFSNKLANKFKTLFGCQLLNNTQDLEFFSAVLKIFHEMFETLQPVCNLFAELQEKVIETEGNDFITGFSNMPIEFLGTFVVDVGDNLCVDLFTGSLFAFDEDGYLELLELSVKEDYFPKLPEIGSKFEKPSMVLSDLFLNLESFLKEPHKTFQLYREEWMMIYMDLVHGAIINSILNNNEVLLSISMNMGLPPDIINTSITCNQLKSRKRSLGLKPEEHEEKDNHKYNVNLSPLVRADLHFSRSKYKVGNRGSLLRICLLLNNFKVLNFLTENGLSLKSKILHQRSSSLHWVTLTSKEQKQNQQETNKIKLDSNFKEISFMNLIFENLFNTKDIRSHDELNNFEEKIKIFNELNEQSSEQPCKRVLFQIYRSTLEETCEGDVSKLDFNKLEEQNLAALKRNSNAFHNYASYHLISLLNQSTFDDQMVFQCLFETHKFEDIQQFNPTNDQIEELFNYLSLQLRDGDSLLTYTLNGLAYLLSDFQISKNLINEMTEKMLHIHLDNFITNQKVVEKILLYSSKARENKIELFKKLFVKFFRFNFSGLNQQFQKRLREQDKIKVLEQCIQINFIKNTTSFSYLLLPIIKNLSPTGFEPFGKIYSHLLKKTVLSNSDLRVIYEITKLSPNNAIVKISNYKTFLLKLFLLPTFSFEKICVLTETTTLPLVSDLIKIKVLHQTIEHIFKNKLESKSFFIDIMKSLRKLAKKYKRKDMWFDGILYFIKHSSIQLELSEEIESGESSVGKISRYFDKKSNWEIDFDLESDSCVLIPTMCINE